jgi:hypothetical protein
MLQKPSYCSFGPDLHELWSKEGAGVKLGIWPSTTNPLNARVKWDPIGVCYTTVAKIFSTTIRFFACTLKTDLIWERYEHPKFWATKVLILGVPLRSPKKKWHLDVVLVDRHGIYYREGNGVSSQKLWVVWSLCLRLSLLSPSHHFHSTCTNRPLFLVV